MRALNKRQVATLIFACLASLTPWVILHLLESPQRYLLYEVTSAPHTARVDGNPASVQASATSSEIAIAADRGIRRTTLQIMSGPKAEVMLLQGVVVNYGYLVPFGIEGIDKMPLTAWSDGELQSTAEARRIPHGPILPGEPFVLVPARNASDVRVVAASTLPVQFNVEASYARAELTLASTITGMLYERESVATLSAPSSAVYFVSFSGMYPANKDVMPLPQTWFPLPLTLICRDCVLRLLQIETDADAVLTIKAETAKADSQPFWFFRGRGFTAGRVYAESAKLAVGSKLMTIDFLHDFRMQTEATDSDLVYEDGRFVLRASSSVALVNGDQAIDPRWTSAFWMTLFAALLGALGWAGTKALGL